MRGREAGQATGQPERTETCQLCPSSHSLPAGGGGTDLPWASRALPVSLPGKGGPAGCLPRRPGTPPSLLACLVSFLLSARWFPHFKPPFPKASQRDEESEREGLRAVAGKAAFISAAARRLLALCLACITPETLEFLTHRSELTKQVT